MGNCTRLPISACATQHLFHPERIIGVSARKNRAMDKRRVLIAGASGRTGQLIVKQLQTNPNWIIRVLVRTDEQAALFSQQGLEVSMGDVRDTTTSWADAAMRDVHSVISVLGGMPFRANNLWRVDYEGTLRLLAAAKIADVTHYIFVSTTGLQRQRSLLQPLSFLFYPKLLAEDAIRRSGLEYTILRPASYVERPVSENHSTRAQVASACIAALDRLDTRNKTWDMGSDRLREPDADTSFGKVLDIAV